MVRRFDIAVLQLEGALRGLGPSYYYGAQVLDEGGSSRMVPRPVSSGQQVSGQEVSLDVP